MSRQFETGYRYALEFLAIVLVGIIAYGMARGPEIGPEPEVTR